MDGGDWKLEDKYQSTKWLTREEFSRASVSTAMKKILKLYDAPEKVGGKRKREDTDSSQRSISSFFLPKQSKVLKEIKTE